MTDSVNYARPIGCSSEWRKPRSERGEYRTWLDLSHLRVMVAQPEYLLAMMCLAFRIGAEFHDEDDIR